jgi:Prokaryotic dksA/traR C4-type zinc finger
LRGRDRDLVETLLRERSADLMRTRIASRIVTLGPSAEPAPPPLPRREEAQATGTCADCGGTILAARLKTIPDAVRCASCQLEYESAV